MEVNRHPVVLEREIAPAEVTRLLPVDLEDEAGAGDASNNSEADASHLTGFSAFALLVASMIGSGIFASPSLVDRNVPSPGAAILIWAISGLITWTGATSFAEFGAAIPRNGGMQEYLKYIYGDFLASIMSFTWIVVVKPAQMAMLSLIFAEYWFSVILAGDSDSHWPGKVLALAALFSVLGVNLISRTSSTWLTNKLLFIKLFAVVCIIILAMLAVVYKVNGDGEEPNNDWVSHNWFADRYISNDTDWAFRGIWDLSRHYAVALFAGLYAYSGWDKANFVAAEMKNTSRDLPRAIHYALPTVTACYVLANICYYIILPWNVIADSDAVAVAVGRKTFGSIGGLFFAVLVSVSCLGSINANMFITGKLIVAAAEQNYMPRALNSQTQVPVTAIAFESLATSIYILIGDFAALLQFIGFTEYFFCFLTVFGLLLLRRREPLLVRPYKSPLWVPAIFCVASLCLVVRALVASPLQVVGFGALIIVFPCWRRYEGRALGSTTPRISIETI